MNEIIQAQAEAWTAIRLLFESQASPIAILREIERQNERIALIAQEREDAREQLKRQLAAWNTPGGQWWKVD